MSLSSASVARPVSTIAAVLGLVLLGSVSLGRLPVALLPDVTLPVLTIRTDLPGAAPPEVSRFVAEPIEEAIAATPGLVELRSIARTGQLTTTARFAWGTDMASTVLTVRERLDNARGRLPEQASRPTLLTSDPGERPIAVLALTGPGDVRSVSRTAEEVHARRLEQLEGVASVAVVGAPKDEIRVDVDPARMRALGLSPNDVARAIEAANATAPGGTIRRGQFRFSVRALTEFRTPEEIGATPVGPAQRGIRLADIATISLATADPLTMVQLDGAPAVGLVVYKDAGANTVAVTRRLYSSIGQLEEEFPDIGMTVVAAQARFVQDALSNLGQEIVLGGFLSLLVILFFLRDWRASLAIGLIVPLSVLIALVMLQLLNVSVNILSLGGLALGVGLLVDNAIVVAEAGARLRDQGMDPVTAARVAGEEVAGPLTAGTLTTLLVFGPIIFVQGLAAALFRDLSLSVVTSLSAALVLALTLMPVMMARRAAHQPVATGPVWGAGAGARLIDLYERGMEWSLDHPRRVFGIALVSVGLMVLLAGRLPKEILPQVDEGVVVADLTLPEGTAIEETARQAGRLENAAESLGSAEVYARIGAATDEEVLSGADPGSSSTAQLIIPVPDGKSAAKFAEALRAQVPDLAAGSLALDLAGQTEFGSLIGREGRLVRVEVGAPRLATAAAWADTVRMAMATLPRLSDVREAQRGTQPMIEISLERRRIAERGIDVQAVAQALAGGLGGVSASELRETDRRTPITVRLAGNANEDLAAALQTTINGVPVGELVTVEEVRAPIEVVRVNQRPVTVVEATVETGGTARASSDVARLLRTISAPPGVTWTLSGADQERRRTTQELLLVALLSVALVFLVLAGEFASFTVPLVIMLTVPLAAAGGIVVLWLTGQSLNAVSMIGMVVMIGIADNDAVVKLDAIRRFREQGVPLRKAIIAGGRQRLRAIAMTSLTTIMGVMPLVFGLGSGGELYQPLAAGVIGGSISATLVTFFLMPTAYYVIERRGETPSPPDPLSLRERGDAGEGEVIGWAVRRPAVIAATALALCLAGGVAFTRLPLATRTTVELPKISVTVSWPGAAAEVVETYLTSPIEAAVQAVRGVRKTSSESSEGQSRLTIELDPTTDVRMARLAILERMELLRPDMPPGARAPSVANWVPEELSESPLIRYTITGPYTAGALSRIARDDIAPRLSAVPGVAGINMRGDADLGVAVAYDPTFLRRQGVSPGLLFEAIANSRIVQSLGDEKLGASVRTVVLRDQPRAIEDLADLPIAGPGGRVFRLGDLATVRPEEDARGRFYRINGLPAVSLDVSRLAAADAIQTAARVRALVAELQPVLPPGVKLRIEDDESIELAKQLTDLVRRGLLAAVSVALVLLLTLRNLRATALVLASAAVAIAGTALGLYLLEIPANLLTLAGLGMGIGVLVQNGLVVMERLRTAPDTPEGRADAGRRIMPAVVGSTLTTGVVLLPFLYLQGNARAAFVPFAAAFALALGSSVVSSLVMVPALGAGHGVARGGWPRLDRAYRWVLIKLLRWRWVTVTLTTAGLAVLTWGFINKVPRYNWGDWFGQRTTLSASLGFPRGSDPVSLDLGMREFERLVVGVPGVEQVVTMAMGDRAYMQVVFEKEAGLGALPSQLQEALTQRAVLIGGASVSVQGSGPGFNSGYGGGGSVSYRVKLLGYSFDGVERLALDLKERLERIPRVREVDINAGSFWGQDKAFTVTLVPDRAALARYGLTARDLSAAVSREVRGPVGAQRIDIGGEEIEVNLKAAGARERSLEELRSALVPTASGAPVRIGDLATVEEREGLGTVTREDQQYVRIVGYDFRGPNKLAERTHNAFMASIAVPPGYSVADQRFDYNRDESGKGLWLVFAIGVALVVLAVALVFNSVWATAMVALSLPIAVAGVGAAFWVAGTAFGREAAVGVILVVGLAVNQAILLVHGALERRGRAAGRQGGSLSGADVVRVARDRSAMIVLVTLTTVASLLPLAIGTDPDSLFGSIALATAGGTLFGTIGAMFVLPVLLAAVRPRRGSEAGRQ